MAVTFSGPSQRLPEAPLRLIELQMSLRHPVGSGQGCSFPRLAVVLGASQQAWGAPLPQQLKKDLEQFGFGFGSY